MNKKTKIKPFYFNLDYKDKKNFYNGIDKILNTGNLILGKYTKEFEKEFSQKHNAKYGIAVNTGTSALEILLSYETKMSKTLIAVPTNTNFATVASLIKSNGYPVYLDMNQKYLAPSLEEVKKKYFRNKFKGLLWVHIGGIISPDFDKIVRFCKEKKIFLIEDCAHAHGSKFKKKYAGTFGSAGAFSFFPTKVMTTMEGGMIITNNIKIRNFAISMRNQGKGLKNFGCYHLDFGNSWRMLEISALLGLIQLKKLNYMIKKRTTVSKIYSRFLKRLGIAHSITDHMQVASNYKFIIFGKNKRHVDYIKSYLLKKNIICGGGVYELPCHKQPVFKEYNKYSQFLKVSEKYCPLQICLPIHHNMDKETSEHCIKKLIEIY